MKFGRKSEEHLFQRQSKRNILKNTKDFMARQWYTESQQMDPLFLQLFKFKPSSQLFKWRRLYGFVGLLAGLHGYLVFNKIMIDDHYVREEGSVVPLEFPFYYAIWRNIKLRIHMTIVTNLFINSTAGEGIEFPRGQLAPYRVQMMRLN
jgi:hypothetical protein